MNSINIIVQGSKKKMETCTFKLNIRENRFLLSTDGGATCRHYAYFIHVLLFFINPLPPEFFFSSFLGT